MLAGDPAETVDKAEEFLKEQPLSTYYDEVAIPGLRIAQNDVTRGVLDRLQIERIKAAVIEVVDDPGRSRRRQARGATTHDSEAAAGSTSSRRPSELPVLKKEDLAPEWQADMPLLCVAGRGPLDEAAAMMLAQLLEKHGLGARVEGAEAIASSNILRLDTSGLALVCLSYFDASSPAHMRYTIAACAAGCPMLGFSDAGWRMSVGNASRHGDHSLVRSRSRTQSGAEAVERARSLRATSAGPGSLPRTDRGGNGTPTGQALTCKLSTRRSTPA
jgi:hypothetical protein